MEHKATISKFLFEKAKSDLLAGIEANGKNLIDEEIQLGINVNLLLGIAIEGIINHLGEELIGENDWKDMEKSATLAKWVIILKLSQKEVKKGEEPFQTIKALKTIRDKIAHPKLKTVGDDVIVVDNKGNMTKNPTDDFNLPAGNFGIYIGYEEYLKNYSIKETLKNMTRVLKAIKG